MAKILNRRTSGDTRMFHKGVPSPAHSPQSLLGENNIFWKERIKMRSRQNFLSQNYAYESFSNENILSELMVTDDRKIQPVAAEVSLLSHL